LKSAKQQKETNYCNREKGDEIKQGWRTYLKCAIEAPMKKNGASPATTESHCVRVDHKETSRRPQNESSTNPEKCCDWKGNQSTHKVEKQTFAKIGPREHEPNRMEKWRRA